MKLKKILLLALGHLSCDLNGGAIPALLPYLAAVHHLDYQTCGTLAFAYSAMSSIIQPLFGLLADKKRCSAYIPFGILLAGGGLGAVGYVESYWAIFAALLICGTGSAVFHPEGARYANFASGAHKGIGLSIFSVGGNSGFAVGPLVVAVSIGGIPLADGVFGGFGLHGTAVFAAIAFCMAALLFWGISVWSFETSPAAPASAGAADMRNDWRAFGVLSVCIITRSVLFLGLNTYLPLYWKNVFQQSAQTGNAVLAAFCVVGVGSNLLGGFLADRWGFVRTIRWFSLIVIPFVAFFPFAQNPYIAACLLIPIAVGLYAPFSSMVVLGQRYLARNVGFASGITLGVAMSVGGMFTPLIGWVADGYGLPFAMHLLVGAAVICTLTSLLLKTDR